MFIILSIILGICLYYFKSINWILFKINKNKLLKSTDSEIIQILIEVLNNSKVHENINFKNILLTFDTKLDDNKLECTIYSWMNNNYVKYPCQFIYEKNKNEPLKINAESKIIVKMNVWKGSLQINTFNVQ